MYKYKVRRQPNGTYKIVDTESRVFLLETFAFYGEAVDYMKDYLQLNKYLDEYSASSYQKELDAMKIVYSEDDYE